MNIEKNKSLRNLNAFKLDIIADEYLEFTDIADLDYLAEYFLKKDKKIIIGDATNILFLNDFKGLVVKNSLKGIDIIERGNYYYIKVFSGENWSDFVKFSVNMGLGGGIENLTDIPGKVGSGIVQNIGAYGVEIKDILFSVQAYSLRHNKIINFKPSELSFGYRESLFKKKSNRYFIISAIFKLQNKPEGFILDYGNIKKRRMIKKESRDEENHTCIYNVFCHDKCEFC